MARKLAKKARDYVGKNWSRSSLTREKLLGNLERIAEFMEGQGLQSIAHLKTKHVEAFFRELEERGLSASTTANYATAMRELAEGIGKRNIVPRSNEELGISRADRFAPKEADQEKLEEIKEKLHERGEWQGLAFEMQQAFGLRLKESLMSHRTELREGRPHLVVEGSKGGRPRELPIETAQQAELLQRVQEYIQERGQASLIPADKTLKQGYDRQKNDLHRLGATKENNANSHLNRHARAQDMARDGRSDIAIAQYLGHGRKEVTKHYK